MKITHKPFAAALLTVTLAGCASHDYRDVEILGAATEHNIQMHSVRDVTLPNKKVGDGGQGSTGANAVAALRGPSSKPAGSPSQ